MILTFHMPPQARGYVISQARDYVISIEYGSELLKKNSKLLVLVRRSKTVFRQIEKLELLV